jgi:hypothetical protein
MCARIKEDFQEWPENDQTLYLKDYLFLHWYSVDKGVPGLTPRDKQAITDAALKFKTVSNAELFYQLWLNVPLDDARKRLRDSKRPAAAQAVQPAPPPQIQQQIQVQQPQAPQQIQPEVQAAPAPQPQAAPAPEQQAPQAPAPQPRPARKKAPAADGKEAPTGIGASEW